MSQPDTIWWCLENKRSEDKPCVPWRATHTTCGEFRLVSPTALVIERDGDGEWPDYLRLEIPDILERFDRRPDDFHGIWRFPLDALSPSQPAH